MATHCQENVAERARRVGEGEGMFSVYLVCARFMRGPWPECSHPILSANLIVRDH